MTPALRALPEAELFDWLRLIRTEGIGPRTFLGLLARFGSARAALEGLPRLKGRPMTPTEPRAVAAEIAAAARLGARFLPLCDPAYPPALRAIESAPPVIAVLGGVEILQRPMVGIVGSRNASANGLVMTERLARGIGEGGVAIVSGLARGVDAKAHLASLETGTVAVLAGGLDRIYPSEHAGLVPRIAAGGAVISEMPLGWTPRGRDFPRRNRIVSGLGLAVVVVEAARRSGSLITARFAGEQGREVFAVPGSPLDPRAEGTNDLIKQGATVCTAAEDVLDALGPMTSVAAEPPLFRDAAAARETYWDETDLDDWGSVSMPGPGAGSQPDDEEAPELPAASDRIDQLLTTTPIDIDDLIRLSGFPARTVQTVLFEMELRGAVARHGLNLVARRPE